MVTVTASGGSALRMDFNFDRLTDIDSDITTKKSSSLVIKVDGLRYAFTGVDVRYNRFDEPTSGTITGLDISRNGSVLFHAEGFSIGAPAFYLATYAPNDPFALIFAGDDSFQGGALDDYIRDVGGHNIVVGGAGRDMALAGDRCLGFGLAGSAGQRPRGDDDPQQIGAFLGETLRRGVEPGADILPRRLFAREVDDAGLAAVQICNEMDGIGQIAAGLAATGEDMTGDIGMALAALIPKQRTDRLGRAGTRSRLLKFIRHTQHTPNTPGTKRGPAYSAVRPNRYTQTR